MDWKNQFYDLPPAEILRTTVEIPHSVNAQIKTYEPKTGVLQTTISILLSKLVHELAQSRILVADRYGYQYALANATIVLGGKPDVIVHGGVEYIPRSTAQQPAAGLQHSDTKQAVGGDDVRGTKPVARKAKGTSKLPSPAKPRRSNGGEANEEGK